MTQYNLQDCNTIGISDDWFVHPWNGGCCIFGQLMALVTCLILLQVGVSKSDSYRWILPTLGLGWVILPRLMNNDWITYTCIPLALLWGLMSAL